MTKKTTRIEELRGRLQDLTDGEEAAWQRFERARAEDSHLAREIENSEHLLRQSLLAHHALRALRMLGEGNADGVATLQRWADNETHRLVRGIYLQRSTSLFARARGEYEHEAVAEVLGEVRGFLRLATPEEGA